VNYCNNSYQIINYSPFVLLNQRTLLILCTPGVHWVSGLCPSASIPDETQYLKKWVHFETCSVHNTRQLAKFIIPKYNMP